MTRIRRRMRALALLAPLALATLLGGCADSAGSIEPLQGSWTLANGSDADGAFIDPTRPVTLEVEGSEFSGNSPCNVYSGTIVARGGGIDLGEGIATTEQACADPEQQALEGRYYAALSDIERAERSSGELVLTGPGVELVFAAD
ncbi:META domain-containing protein [Yonghaparkia sp. Root332]|uniref:META domain-containing protein n=1 Tax=Yonghaparkia sp. Root332 TaxID=1736516 RepID=UPI00138ECA55|nr:META domain-containing protein [Yonghaparkia sp. Root332]